MPQLEFPPEYEPDSEGINKEQEGEAQPKEMVELDEASPEQSVESQLEEERGYFDETVQEIKKSVEGLDGLSDEEIKELAMPDSMDKLMAGGRFVLESTPGFSLGAGGAFTTALLMGGPSVEKTLTMLGVGATAATVGTVAEWFTEGGQKRFENLLGERMVKKISRAAEGKE